MVRILSLVVALSLAASSVAVADNDSAPASAERDLATVHREAERVLGRSHQRQLPGFDPEPDRPDGPRARHRDAARDRDPMRRRDPRIDPRTGRPRDPGDRAGPGEHDAQQGPLSGVATFLLWGLVLVIALMGGIAIYAQLTSFPADEQPDVPRTIDDAQLAAVVERPRDDADELAAHGRFADAIHTLLLRTLHELASQHLVRVTPAMTSREILGKVALLGDAREGLAGLIVAVEQTWFGDDVPQLADYQRCRAQFDRFAAAYRRGAGAAA